MGRKFNIYITKVIMKVIQIMINLFGKLGMHPTLVAFLHADVKMPSTQSLLVLR